MDEKTQNLIDYFFTVTEELDATGDIETGIHLWDGEYRTYGELIEAVLESVKDVAEGVYPSNETMLGSIELTRNGHETTIFRMFTYSVERITLIAFESGEVDALSYGLLSPHSNSFEILKHMARNYPKSLKELLGDELCQLLKEVLS